MSQKEEKVEKPKWRGFASMDEEKMRQIASKGGRAAHEKGTARQWTPEAAAEAGRKGGAKVSADRDHMSKIGKKGGTSISQDRDYMAALGRKGGAAVSKDRKHMSKIGKKGGHAGHGSEESAP
jgi:hypothetical protein